MAKFNAPDYFPPTLADWRSWLEANHNSLQGVWLVFGKKGTAVENFPVGQAVDEAICFGWIDSVINRRDEESYKIYFAPRNPKSNWSRVNKEKVERLEREGRLAPAGLEMIRVAKETGTWTALDDVENLVIPPDLMEAFDAHPGSLTYWEAFPRSAKRAILEWIFTAKRSETRAKRIQETAAKAAQNVRANFQ